MHLFDSPLESEYTHMLVVDYRLHQPQPKYSIDYESVLSVNIVH